MLNAVATSGRLAISSTAADIQQRSKQRTAEVRQQQVQDQQQQRQHLELTMRQLRDRGAQVLRAGIPCSSSSSSSSGQVCAAGLQMPGCLTMLSADAVAAEVSSRAEKLKARLAAAALLMQEAAVAAAADAAAPTGCDEQDDAAGFAESLCTGDTSSSCSSDGESAHVHVQQQAVARPAGAFLCSAPHRQHSSASHEAAAAAGSSAESIMDSDIEELLAGMYKPAQLPDWSFMCQPATTNEHGSSSKSSSARLDSEGVDGTFTAMFKLSLPPGL
jgi:hypothetical protein